jgi:hypothetical protein
MRWSSKLPLGAPDLELSLSIVETVYCLQLCKVSEQKKAAQTIPDLIEQEKYFRFQHPGLWASAITRELARLHSRDIGGDKGLRRDVLLRLLAPAHFSCSQREVPVASKPLCFTTGLVFLLDGKLREGNLSHCSWKAKPLS